jgi:hypothetical protein
MTHVAHAKLKLQQPNELTLTSWSCNSTDRSYVARLGSIPRQADPLNLRWRGAMFTIDFGGAGGEFDQCLILAVMARLA